MCLFPIAVKRKIFTPMDSKAYKTFVSFVPCRKCSECMFRRASEWSTCLLAESLTTKGSVYFVTLTYEDEHLCYGEQFASLSRDDCSKFIDRIRHNLPCKLRYFISGEYGEKFARPHLHFIAFLSDFMPYCQFENYVINAWKKGFVALRNFCPEETFYVAKYSVKQLGEGYYGVQSPFFMASQGLGLEFFLMRKEYLNKNMCTKVNTRYRVLSVPYKYYDKIYSPFVSSWLKFQHRSSFYNSEIVSPFGVPLKDVVSYTDRVLRSRQKFNLVHSQKSLLDYSIYYG